MYATDLSAASAEGLDGGIVAKLEDTDATSSMEPEELVLPPLGEWEADACKAITLRLGTRS